MTVIKYNNRVNKFDGRILNYKSEFEFVFIGNQFPNSGIQPELKMTFTSPVSVKVDFGNGVVNTYNSILGVFLMSNPGNTGAAQSSGNYIYPDGLNIERKIKLTISNPDALSYISFQLLTIKEQVLFINFNLYKNLIGLAFRYLGGRILDIDASFLNLTSFVEYTSFGSFSLVSKFYGAIPDVVLAKNTLKRLSVGDAGFNGKTFAQSKLDQVATSFPDLEAFSIFLTKLTDTNGGQGALPSNFVNLTKLREFTIDQGRYTKPPDILNYIPALERINIVYSNYLTSFGDLSVMASRLKLLNFTYQNNLTTTLPVWMSAATSLKGFFMTDSLIGTTRVNLWVDNWYAFIVASAAISGANTLPFRGMTHRISGTNAIPSGTYQQPSGYVAGVSNGTPVSQKEKVWVMVNQYGHNWTTN